MVGLAPRSIPRGEQTRIMSVLKQLMQFLGWPVICGLLAAIIILDHYPRLLNPDSGIQQSPLNGNAPAAEAFSYARAVERAAPAVVNIYTSKVVRQELPPAFNDPFFRYFLNRNNIRQHERVQRSLGSGVIITPAGYILTNNHVISGADEILVLLQDGREALATLAGADPETDLAALKIDLDNLEPITIGDPAQAMVGDVVLAIGNPYGFGQTVTQGIISATGRYGLRLTTYENFIQTDAAINPGNSGGALVDAEGRLLGINTAIYTKTGGSQGIGLATPSDLAVRIMADLIQHGKVIRGWLGIEVQALHPAYARAKNLPLNNGIVVTDIYPGGPAQQGGLKPGDIITHINGRPVGDGQAGMNYIAATRPGEKVEIAIYRDARPMTITATTGLRPDLSAGA